VARRSSPLPEDALSEPLASLPPESVRDCGAMRFCGGGGVLMTHQSRLRTNARRGGVDPGEHSGRVATSRDARETVRSVRRPGSRFLGVSTIMTDSYCARSFVYLSPQVQYPAATEHLYCHWGALAVPLKEHQGDRISSGIPARCVFGRFRALR